MRALRGMVVVVLVVLASIVWPGAARALDGERITDVTMEYALRADGAVAVTEHLT